jgi:hypothetical protein
LAHRELLVLDTHMAPPELVGRARRSSLDKSAHNTPPKTTAADYLEKIFQIPFWLPVFSGVASMRMADGILRKQVEIGQDQADGGQGETVPPLESMPGFVRDGSSSSIVLPEERSLAPEGLKITPGEFAALIRVAPLAGETPRQVKRFANLYRLVKVGLGERDLEAFVDADDPAYRPAAVLLATVTGASKAMADLFAVLEAAEDELTLEQVADRILWKATRRGSKDPLTPQQRARITANRHVYPATIRLKAAAAEMGEISVKQIRPWMRVVRRYSFDGHLASP